MVPYQGSGQKWRENWTKGNRKVDRKRWDFWYCNMLVREGKDLFSLLWHYTVPALDSLFPLCNPIPCSLPSFYLPLSLALATLRSPGTRLSFILVLHLLHFPGSRGFKTPFFSFFLFSLCLKSIMCTAECVAASFLQPAVHC